MNKLILNITSLVASIILFAGVPVLYAWTSPTGTPPANNVPAPINVGSSSQNKTGVLGLGGLAVFGKSLFTETSGYQLPSTKPSMLIGVNGAIGAREYCDQNGNNCVNTLSGGGTVATNSSKSSIIASGILGGNADINLGSGWNLIEMTGAYVSQDAAPTGGYIYRIDGKVKATIVEASGIILDATLTSKYQCAYTLCVKLLGDDVVIKPGSNKIAYLVWN